MLSATTRFKETMSKAGVQPVYVVEVHLSATDVRYFSTTHVALSDLTDPVYPSISDVVGVASSIDIESRSVSIGEFHVHFLDDGVLRDIIKGEFIYGKKVIVKMGNTELSAYSDFLNVAVGVSRDVIPSEGELDLEVADMLDLLRNKTIGPRYWLNGHPLEVILDILKAAGVDSSVYDATTLAWDADLTRSHFLVSRYDAKMLGFDEPFLSNGVSNEGESAQGLIEELCELLWGSFAPDELGVFKYKAYQSTSVVDRNLSADDFGGFEQSSSADPLYNSITMKVGAVERKGKQEFHGQEETIRTANIGFTQEDTASQARYNFVGDLGKNDTEISTSWLAGPSSIARGFKVVSGTLTPESGVASRTGIDNNLSVASVLFDHDAINLTDAAYNGFSGCKFDLGTISAASRTGLETTYPHAFPVQTNRNVSASRPAYILIEGVSLGPVQFATVKTQPTIGDTTIELESVNASNYTTGMVLAFGNDANTGNFGYAVSSYNTATQVVTISSGIQSAVTVGTPVFSICNTSAIVSAQAKQWQSEVVKCVEAEAYKMVGYNSCRHGELFRWPGNDGSLGPWDVRTQRLPRSEDLAITAIGDNPTVAVEGDGYTYQGANFTWPYSTLYNMRYPYAVRYRFEGTSGAIGSSNPYGHPGLGSAASGRGQFGTETPVYWQFLSDWTGDPADDPSQEDASDGLYYAKAWDITILVDSVNRRIERFKNGCPRVKIKTPLEHADLQLGDFITLESDLYSAYGRDGCDSDTVFEIISKTVDALADSPGCEFELAWVRDSGVTFPASAYNYVPFVAQQGFKVAENTTVFNQDTADETELVLTISGLEVKTDSGS